MSFSWENYILLGDELLAHPIDKIEEACYRTSISRMYYGLFCMTREILWKKGASIPRTGEAHQLVQQELLKINNNDAKELAKWLSKIHVMRNKSDYDNYNNFAIKRNDAILMKISKDEAFKLIKKL